MKKIISLILVLVLGLAVEVANADFTFGEPVNLGPLFNTPYGDYNVCISADGLEMYISSDRPGGLGYFDLWRSTRENTDNPWEPLVNVQEINSRYNEVFPCLSADGLTLYFSDWYGWNAAGGPPSGSETFNPGTLKMARTYYWRVDEFDSVDTYKGDVWSFITDGAVEALDPVNGAVDVTQTPVLTWAPGFGATHEIFFGTDSGALEKKASGSLGSESFEPGQLEWNTTYYWRVDEANSINTDSPWTGPLWSFTTANFLIIDDMEAYNDLDPADPLSNRIFNAWIDGYGDPTNGSLVGNDMPPFAEQTIVNSGNQSMPMSYDNSAAAKSEATLTLTTNNDWTVKSVNTLTIWYRGSSSNTAEQMYVTLNGSATVDNEDPDAALINTWTPWNIPLQAFADQGVNLTNVDSITLGLNSVTGGTGTMYFDDIRLYPPAP